MTDKTIYENAPAYCHYYFDLIEGNDLMDELEKSKIFTLELFGQITPDKENHKYAPGKWTTKEVLKHIIDCERVYAYRALRFSRFDDTELPGFDENKYIAAIKGIELNLNDLREEYLSVRKSSVTLFKSITDEMLHFKGRANKVEISARAIGFMTVGHNLHHLHFIRSKYLNPVV